MDKKLLSYNEREVLFKLLDCSNGNKTFKTVYYSELMQVRHNIENFLDTYDKEASYADLKEFTKTKSYFKNLVKAMDTIYGSDSVFQNNSFVYGILYTAKLIDCNQLTQAKPVYHSKLIVMDILKYRDDLLNQFNNVFLTNNYVYNSSHIDLFNSNIKTLSFLAIKIRQLYQLKNYLIYNIKYLKKIDHNRLLARKDYSELLKTRTEHITSLADVDNNNDDYFGSRSNKRETEYDNDLDGSVFKIYDEWESY